MNVAVFTDLARGQGGNLKDIESLRASGILAATQIFTAADFVPQPEADLEDLWGEDGFLLLVNEAYSLQGRLDAAALASTGEKSPRVIKRVEAWFRTQPGTVPEFNHFAPAEWLITNPHFIGNHAAAFQAGLDRFESLFQRLNPLIRK
jgi:hypothetical protein